MQSNKDAGPQPGEKGYKKRPSGGEGFEDEEMDESDEEAGEQ